MNQTLNADLDVWYFIHLQESWSLRRWNKTRTKYHTSKSKLRVWCIQLSSYFYHTVRFTTNLSFQHPIMKTIQVRQTRYAGHCWRSRDELISDVLLWTPTYGQAKAGQPARTYIQQLCEDTGCSPEDLPEVMNDREKWCERVRDIRASSTIW